MRPTTPASAASSKTSTGPPPPSPLPLRPPPPPRVEVVIATHNQQTIEMAVSTMKELHIDPKARGVYFARPGAPDPGPGGGGVFEGETPSGLGFELYGVCLSVSWQVGTVLVGKGGKGALCGSGVLSSLQRRV